MSALDVAIRFSVGGGERRFAVEASFSLASGVLVMFGPSGVGKSLTLRALAGLVGGVTGQIVASGVTLLDTDRGVDVPARARGAGYVPQDHGLFPFTDVAGNVGFGLPRAERRGGRVLGLLEELGLARLADARVEDLSGGERQRVALARALACSPRLLLLDEPFASLDGASRASLRDLLAKLLARRGTPAILVTHARDDALALASRVVIFERGRTTKEGGPRELLAPQGFRLEGTASGPPEAIEAGRARVRLHDAILEGPVEVVGAASTPGERTVALDLERRVP